MKAYWITNSPAMRNGYHSDPRHSKSISPYQGEMRRRMWAMICSVELGFSTQMGLPSGIKYSLCDAMLPQNLQDSDFDTSSVDLPPARPSTELTSSTVLIAKLHAVLVTGPISDTVNSPQPLTYEDLVSVNTKLDEMNETLPAPCRLKRTSEALLDPPSLVFQVCITVRVYFGRYHAKMHLSESQLLYDIPASTNPR